jgi:hypothetical protein
MLCVFARIILKPYDIFEMSSSTSKSALSNAGVFLFEYGGRS